MARVPNYAALTAQRKYARRGREPLYGTMGCKSLPLRQQSLLHKGLQVISNPELPFALPSYSR